LPQGRGGGGGGLFVVVCSFLVIRVTHTALGLKQF